MDTETRQLISDAVAWAAAKGRTLDEELLFRAVDLHVQHGEHPARHWPKDSARELMLDTWPDFGPDEIPDVALLVDTLDSFWRFLRSTGRMTGASASPADLLKEARRSRTWMRQALEDAVQDADLYDPLGALADEADDLDPLALAEVLGALPPADVIAEQFSASGFGQLVLGLASWVGKGRRVTNNGVLGLAEGRRAYEELNLREWERPLLDLIGQDPLPLLASDADAHHASKKWRSSADSPGLHRIWTAAVASDLVVFDGHMARAFDVVGTETLATTGLAALMGLLEWAGEQMPLDAVSPILALSTPGIEPAATRDSIIEAWLGLLDANASIDDSISAAEAGRRLDLCQAMLGDAGLWTIEDGRYLRTDLGTAALHLLAGIASDVLDEELDFGDQAELAPRRDEPATYVVRVELDGVRPAIWRQLELPSELSLDALHQVLQVVCGWDDSHLHAFALPGSPPFVNDALGGDPEAVAEGDLRLDEVLSKLGDTLHYVYDFGDSWELCLTLEKIEDAQGSVALRCIGGARAFPPEDCGGVPGYEDLLAALSAKKPTSWQRELIAWVGEDWNPDHFESEPINRALGAPLPSDPSAGRAQLPSVESIQGLPPSLRELALRSRTPADLLDALVAANPAGATASDAAIEAATKPLQLILDVVGDGVQLTQSGYLRPAQVVELAAGMNLDELWVGKNNRENQTWPVLRLRESATRLGLLRKAKGRLTVTSAGRKLASDPIGLWTHVAGRLPLESEGPGSDAARLELIRMAAFEASPQPPEWTVRQFASLGWRADSGADLDEHIVRRQMDRTRDVLNALGCYAVITTPTASGVALAKAVLRALQ